MGFINVVKTMSQSLGPVITGILANSGLFWVAFVLAGSAKAVYDLGILAVFIRQQSRDPEDTQRTETPLRDAEST